MTAVAKKDDFVIKVRPANVDELSTASVTSRLEKVSACEKVSQGAKAPPQTFSPGSCGAPTTGMCLCVKPFPGLGFSLTAFSPVFVPPPGASAHSSLLSQYP